MKPLNSTGIVLTRTDFGEADRILTMLTPDFGKLHLIAKGVRKERSKLAGGIELFSVSNITFIKGRGDIDTLISTRLIQHYRNIVTNLQRVQLGYELIKLLNKSTEDNVNIEYFELLKTTLRDLDKLSINENLIRIWFYAQLLRLDGHGPNLRADPTGQKLEVGQNFSFNLEKVAFVPQKNGEIDTDHIKFLRLIFSDNQPLHLQKVSNLEQLLVICAPIVQSMLNTFVRV
jgi:DNA repair protein RecO (recombination protein O)